VIDFDTEGDIPTKSPEKIGEFSGRNTENPAEGSVFFTDSNGFQLQKRVFSAEKAFPDGTSQRIAPDAAYATALNMFPIVRSAHIAGNDKKLTGFRIIFSALIFRHYFSASFLRL
jgi:hypothetical protein